MTKNIAMCSLALLVGCSGFWGTYEINDNLADAGVMPDLLGSPCDRMEPYELIDGVYKTCCYPDDTARSESNFQKTIDQVQKLSGTAESTVKIGCDTPRQFTLRRLVADVTIGEAAMLPLITRATIIDGSGSTLDAGLVDRHFLVKPAVSLTLKNMKLIKGRATSIPDPMRWPAATEGVVKTTSDAACGGSILAFGRLTLENVFITESRSEHTMLAAGGAICTNGATVTLKNSILYGNSTVAQNSGRAEGAAAYFTATNADLYFSTILANINNTNSSNGAAAIHFVGSQSKTLNSYNSLMINYYSLATLQNATANYAIYLGCGASTNIVLTSAFDKMLKASCAGGATGIPSSLPITNTGQDWPAPTLGPTMISTSITLDGKLQLTTDAGICKAAALDYFGLPRKPSGCMPGAVELRQ
jgi:hypothetical protein